MAKVDAVVKKQVALIEKGEMARAQALTAAQVMSIHITADPDRIGGVISSIYVKSLAAALPK